MGFRFLPDIIAESPRQCHEQTVNFFPPERLRRSTPSPFWGGWRVAPDGAVSNVINLGRLQPPPPVSLPFQGRGNGFFRPLKVPEVPPERGDLGGFCVKLMTLGRFPPLSPDGDISPRSGGRQGGGGLLSQPRRAPKNADNAAPHSSSMIPPCRAVLFGKSSINKFNTPPQAPITRSRAP